MFLLVDKDPPLKKSFDEANSYFQSRRDERRTFVADLETNFKLEAINFCSIGCGFAGEESLLEDKVNRLVLIEPDRDTFSFLQKKFCQKKTVLINKCIEDYEADIVFDIIYASGVSNWMHSSPWHGVPDVFIRFINGNLSADGIFIARIYGGLHSGQVIGSKAYL